MSEPDDETVPDRPRRAAALRYEHGIDKAPRVVAAGAGELADRIVALAREHDVPVRDDAVLADALVRLQLDLDIPPDLYAAVAETLVWAYILDARARE